MICPHSNLVFLRTQRWHIILEVAYDLTGCKVWSPSENNGNAPVILLIPADSESRYASLCPGEP